MPTAMKSGERDLTNLEKKKRAKKNPLKMK
jgi:hypothetical protein